MSDRITITGLEVHAHHGVYPDEQSSGQTFVIDLTAWLDTAAAGASDDLEATIHYGHVAELVNLIVGGERWNLIEKVATRVAESVLTGFPLIESIDVTVHKPQAPINVLFKDVSVTIHRSR